MAVLKWIDYIWFVGESFHRQGKAPGDGAALIMWCWYLDAAMILSTLFHRIAGGLIFYLVIIPVLLAAPFLFCRFRYTAKRQDEIFARHSRKKTGRRFLAMNSWLYLPLRFPLKAVRLNLPFPAVWSMAMMGQ